MKRKPVEREANFDVEDDEQEMKPDWNGKCEVCGASPVVPATGMCGPCTFGEADTVNGNWLPPNQGQEGVRCATD